MKMQTEPPQRIGMIGLGLLGAALAERMRQAGYALAGFDLSAVRLAEFENCGGQTATIEQLAGEPVIVLCLPDSNVVRTVIDELKPALPAGALIIDATTGDPAVTTAIASELWHRQIGYVDATVGGSSQQVRDGQAIVMAGGERTDVQRAAEIIATWGQQWFHLGPAGSGARMKLVLNLALGLQRAVLAEALSLAEKNGIDPAAALEIMKASPAYAKCMDTKGPKMLARDFAPQARLAQHYKDVQLIQQLATQAGASVPLTDVHEEILQRAIALGWGDADNSAILCAYQNREAT
jgi:3-hydroxyisobutyrate dehydrogenase-like beta-hydroxyacid dehydrogenase